MYIHMYVYIPFLYTCIVDRQVKQAGIDFDMYMKGFL